MKLIFEKSVEGRSGVHLPSLGMEEKKDLLSNEFLRKNLNFYMSK